MRVERQSYQVAKKKSGEHIQFKDWQNVTAMYIMSFVSRAQNAYSFWTGTTHRDHTYAHYTQHRPLCFNDQHSLFLMSHIERHSVDTLGPLSTPSPQLYPTSHTDCAYTLDNQRHLSLSYPYPDTPRVTRRGKRSRSTASPRSSLSAAPVEYGRAEWLRRPVKGKMKGQREKATYLAPSFAQRHQHAPADAGGCAVHGHSVLMQQHREQLEERRNGKAQMRQKDSIRSRKKI